MAALRLHMNRDARRIVDNTNRLLDWKDYVKQFPKFFVAAGVLAGFILGPGRKVVPDVNLSQDSIDELLKQSRQTLAAQAPQRSDFASGAFKILTGLAMSGVSILVRKGLDNYFNSQSASNASSSDGAPGGEVT